MYQYDEEDLARFGAEALLEGLILEGRLTHGMLEDEQWWYVTIVFENAAAREEKAAVRGHQPCTDHRCFL